ncbi:glycosyltransferase [Candidatus Wolfebacteria bacterium]|nr:glycosyltransferase [Candidatus Wolfebacteria bacterium]
MKALHINLVYLPAHRYGGPIVSVHNLNKWLAKKGADVTVYTTTIDGWGELDVPTGTPVMLDGVQVYYFRPAKFLRRWFYSRGLHRFLARHIQEFDLIHVTAVFTAASLLVRYYARKHNKPYVMSPRGSLMKEPLAMKKAFVKRLYNFFIEKRNLGDAAAIHFTSERELLEYRAQGFPLRRAIVIPNGVDPMESEDSARSLRGRWEISPSAKIVLFLSRLNWKKGLDTLIPAFYKVKREYGNIVLALVGGDDEGYGAWVKSQITNHRLQIGKDVIFTDMLTGADKMAAYRDASVFVLPSYSENFGMAVVEAMQNGLPVVITDTVGIAPSILEAKAGIVVKKDAVAVAAAILELLKNEEEAKKMGERGQELVRKEFLMPAVADKFIEEYERLIEDYGRKERL